MLELLEDIGRALQSSRRMDAPGEATGFDFDRRVGVYPGPRVDGQKNLQGSIITPPLGESALI